MSFATTAQTLGRELCVRDNLPRFASSPSWRVSSSTLLTFSGFLTRSVRARSRSAVSLCGCRSMETRPPAFSMFRSSGRSPWVSCPRTCCSSWNTIACDSSRWIWTRNLTKSPAVSVGPSAAVTNANERETPPAMIQYRTSGTHRVDVGQGSSSRLPRVFPRSARSSGRGYGGHRHASRTDSRLPLPNPRSIATQSAVRLSSHT